MKKAVLFIGLMILSASFAFAQEAWKTKNFDEWSKTDVEDILNKSAWTVKQEVRIPFDPSFQSVAGAVVPGAAGLGDSMSIKQGAIAPPVDFTFTLRLRSSMAIRLALIRRDQLDTDVKKLTDKEFETYKTRQKGLYECPACKDNYVLTLTSASRENKNYDAVYTTFSRGVFEQLKRYIYLQNDKGEKRELVNFVAPKAPGEEAIFFFPRNNEKGKPLLTKDSKYIVFNTTNNDVNTVTNFKISVSPIIIGDKVDF